MIPIVYKVLTVASCIVIVLMGTFTAINKMGPSTNHIVRFAWILITCGALGVCLTQIFNECAPTPGVSQTMAWFGLCIFLACDRRKYFTQNRLIKTNDSAN
jgi:hypothetical protein